MLIYIRSLQCRALGACLAGYPVCMAFRMRRDDIETITYRSGSGG